MDDITRWLKKTLDHLKTSWQGHLAPAGAAVGAIVVLSFGLTFVIVALLMIAGIVAGAIGDDTVVAVAMIVAGGVSLLLLLGLMVLILPLFAGYVRIVLLLVRGEKPPLNELTWGLKRVVKIVLLLFVQMAGAFVGALFCYVPALVVNAALMFALPAMVDEDLGVMEALRVSWGMARPRLLWLTLLMLALVMVMGFLGYVPIVGPAVAVVVWTTVQVVAYDDLKGRGQVG